MRIVFALVCCFVSEALAEPPADHPPVPKPPVHVCSDTVLKTIATPLTVSYRIAPDGTVGQVVIVQSSGSPAADQAATSCISAWTYEPAIRGGAPVEWQGRVTLHAEEVGGTFMGYDSRQPVTMSNVTPEVAKALNGFIRDLQSRCQAIYRTDARYGDTMKARNRVLVKRLADGHVETTISQSSPVHGADNGALACAAKLIGKHSDLPPTFTVEVEIDWARYFVPPQREMRR